MNILVINSGSSSLKYQLFESKYEEVLARGICERIGLDKSISRMVRHDEETVFDERQLPNHEAALQVAIGLLTDKQYGVIKDISEIDAVGHRIAHGGDRFSDSIAIDDGVLNAIRSCCDLAPLHNPPMITGIEACKAILPGVPMIAVFDTAFHQTIPEEAYLYAIPYELYEQYRIRKYGFHGTSHLYVAQRAAKLLGKPLEELKIITCHLGNGSSICAVKYGKSVDTSMGFTPLDGLVMGTRSGTVDPLLFKYLMDNAGMTVDDINTLFNKKSGVLGISGISSDFRDLHIAEKNRNRRAKLALDIFCYRVKSFIGSYIAVLGGLDALVFTAGIGENDEIVRERILENMECFGISIDHKKNRKASGESDISTQHSKVRTLIVPTNEELAIAKEVVRKLV